MRSIVLATVSLLLLLFGAGCRAPSAPHQYFVLETKLYEHQLEGDSASPGGERRLLLGARETIWMSQSIMRVDAFIAEPPAEGVRRSKVQREHVRWIFDFQRGEVWRSKEKGPFTRTPLVQLEYEIETERRLALIELVDSFVRRDSARGVPDHRLFRGDGVIELEGPGADRLLRARIGVVPGQLWRLLIEQRRHTRFPQRWVAERLLARAMGLTRDEARFVADRARGLPVSFRGIHLGDGRSVIEEERRLVDAQDVTVPAGFFSPTQEDVQSERERAVAVKTWEDLFSQLAGRDESDGDRRWLGALLELERRAGDRLTTEVEAAWRSTDGEVRVELMRLALRRDPEWARSRLRAILSGGSAALAQSAVEAFVLESEPEAVDAALRILRRRRNFTEPIDPGVLVESTLPLLRVVSGLTYDELARDIAPLWAAAKDSRNAPSENESLASELGYWLRWSDSR